jgi:arylformamidase
MFDLKNYNVIDISYTVVPGENPDRPFAIQKALLADRTFRYDILKTHTHVGTHVEVGKHFYPEGKSVTEYDLDTFYGPAVLLSVTEMIVTAEYCENALKGKIKEGDNIVVRNDSGIQVSKEQLYLEGDEKLPRFTPEAAKWLAKFKPKMVILDIIRFGKDIEEGREFHDILMGQGAVLVEFVHNLEAITKDRFYVMALPYKVEGLDSSFCRAIVIEDK